MQSYTETLKQKHTRNNKAKYKQKHPRQQTLNTKVLTYTKKLQIKMLSNKAVPKHQNKTTQETKEKQNTLPQNNAKNTVKVIES